MTERSNARGQCFKDTPSCRLLFWMPSNRHIDGVYSHHLHLSLAPSPNVTCTPTSASKQTRNHHDTCAQPPATLARSRSMGGEIHLD